SFDGFNTDKKSHIRKVVVDTVGETSLFERLERDRHYYLDDAEGWIRFADSITFLDNQQVAVFMRTDDSANAEYAPLQKGRMDTLTRYDSTTQKWVLDTVWTLWTLRPKTQQINAAADDTSRFYLMWRHAYGPGDFSDPASFKLAVKRIDEDKTDEKVEQAGNTFFTEIIGVADNNNKPFVTNTQIFNKQFNDLIIPPFDTSWAGLDVFDNPALGDFRDSLIYRYALDNAGKFHGYTTLYEIEMSGSRKKTTFDDLGWGIMKGTEMVKGNGVKLDRDVDYTINYDMGIVDLISARAKACEKIDIEYQSEALFVPERKMFLGSHGKVDLPFLSAKSYAGASLLFQSTQTNEDIPRLDQEPYNKLLLDINTHIEFEPSWMTGLVNALPLVKTQASSSVTLDVEAAHSRVNPNKSGSAYIDDFEDSKQSDLLSNSSQSWYLASPPMLDTAIDDMSLLLWNHPPAWNWYWFTPRDQDEANRVRRDEIVVLTEEEKKAGMTGSLYEYVLRLHAMPSPPIDEYADRFRKAWAGIMTPISQSFANKELVQYFEFFIKAEGKFEDKGKLLIQMGQMREDVSLNGREPNRQEDSEDTSTIVRSQTDKEGLDLGWDLLPDTAEKYWVPASTPGQWDSLTYGDRRLGADSLDPAKDNWRQYFYNEWDAGMAENYRYTCRRQGDGKTIGSSEDINLDGAVQIAVPERYFQFTVDLADSLSPFIDRTVNYARPGVWRKYRIPLHERIKGYEGICDTVNDPAWSNITTVRLIWTGFDSLQLSREQQLVFYNMELVGNQWIEVADSARVKIRSSVVNTKEDTAYGKIWELKYKDRISRERDEFGYELEQSLRLNFVNLASGDTALVKKTFQYQNLNLSAYERLSLQVFGVDSTDRDMTDMPMLRPLWGGDVRFIFRFGTDSLTYYEYSREILPEWNNPVSIDLKELSNFKDAYMIAHRDSSIEVSDGTLRVHAPAGRQPNFARIQWMALGVARTNASSGIDSLSGEIWVNEMKLTGIRRINGSASRVDVTTKWADLLSLQARMEYESGDFRRMTETRNIPDNSQMSTSMGASIGLEKFLPQEWGLSLPAGVTYNSSLMRPQLKNETDVYLVNEKGEPDGFMDMIRDAATIMTGIERRRNDVTRSEQYQTSSVGRTYYTGYKKTKQDENPVVGFLADRWEADARYSTTIGEVLYGANPAGTGLDAVFAKRDTAETYSGKVRYDLKPHRPPEWLTWTPFKSIKGEWFPSRMKSYEITLLPRTFDIDVADISFGRQRQRDTWRGVSSDLKSYTARHNTRIDHTPLSPLCDMDFSLGVNRDLVDAATEETLEKGKKIFKRNSEWKRYWVLWGEKDRTQHAGMRLSPHLFDWLNTSADYTSDYNAAVVHWLKEPLPYLNTGVKSSLSLEGKLLFDQLFGDLTTAAGKNALAGLFDMMKNGFDRIGLRDVALSYSAGSTLRNDYVSTGLLDREGIAGVKDLLLFQLGVKGRTPLDLLRGEMDDDRFLGMRSRQSYDRPDFYRNDSRIVNRSMRLSSGIALKALDLSFNNISLSRSAAFTIYPDSTRNDTTITFPDLSAGFSTQMLQRIGLIKTNLEGVSVNSSFTWRRSDRLTAAQTGGSSRSDKYDLIPLVSLSGRIKRWPIRFDYRHNVSREINTVLSETGESADTNRNATMHSNELTVNYEIERSSKLSEIKLLMWTIPIKGRTTVGLKLSHSHEREVEADRDDKNFSLVPNLSYIFTDNVTGRIDYTFRQEERGGQTTTTNQLLCVLRISF
ncbi:MAG: hypothetical protein JXA18_11110, partial [Chitinispirillaceae bacterium]|nr:hypothetical protein [Chitinispirillaceae bacterium]